MNNEDVKYAGWMVVSPRADDEAEGAGRSAMVDEVEVGRVVVVRAACIRFGIIFEPLVVSMKSYPSYGLHDIVYLVSFILS